MNEIKVNEHILDDDKYLFIFSVEPLSSFTSASGTTLQVSSDFFLYSTREKTGH